MLLEQRVLAVLHLVMPLLVVLHHGIVELLLQLAAVLEQ
jgi:hypothetical protein